MKILIDTNVILDIVLEREPFVEYAYRFLKTATTVTDLYYIIRKEKGKDTALSFIEDILKSVDVASVDKKIIIEALLSQVSDFEDAIQVCSAKQKTITTIVTRNENDFTKSGLEIYSPKSFLEKLHSTNRIGHN